MGFGVLSVWVLRFLGSGLRVFVYLGFFWGLWVLVYGFWFFCGSGFGFVGFGVLGFRFCGVPRGVAPLAGP